ncbi:MAG: PH domain-containing protein [Candidatus Hadarchaeales archaeon]
MADKEFGPHPNMKRLYHLYLLLVLLPLLLLGLGLSLLILKYGTLYFLLFFSLYFVPLFLATTLVLYWIPRYYSSLRYELREEEVRVRKGVWWKMEHTVPYARVMSVDTVQGPLSRRLGIGSVDIYTAGYTGQAGGGGGPGTRRAEASLIHLSNFREIKEEVLRRVRGRPLFGDSGRIVEELVKIRELLERGR